MTQTFSFTARDGSKRTVGGYRFVAAPAGTARFAAANANLSHLPARVDLRPAMPQVEDQAQTNSCAANATAGAYEYLVRRHLGDRAYDVSRLFIYYNARAILDADRIEDEGSVIACVIEGLKSFGAPSETTWPFDESLVNERPSDEAYAEAASFLVEGAELVPTELEAWKTALAAGNPIIFGLKLFGSFDKHKTKGLVPLPTQSEGQREDHGGHAMLCVGYSDADKVFIVRNSWGDGWGDGGYCYIPYAYLMNEEYNYGDSWIVRRVEVAPPDESTWSESDEPILDDVSGMLASFDDAQYSALLDAMGDIPLEVRMALLFLCAAGADGDVSPDELAVAATQLEPVLRQIGSPEDPARVLQNAGAFVDEVRLEETINIFGEQFPREVLASIVNQLDELAGGDGEENDEERAFVDSLVETWQIPFES